MKAKADDPFLVQERRIDTLSKIYEASEARKSLSDTQRPTVALSDKARTIDNINITSSDFVDFLEKVETQILNMVPIPLYTDQQISNLKREGRNAEVQQYLDALMTIRTELAPLWIAQFKRLKRKALKEGKVPLVSLDNFDTELRKLVRPFLSDKDFDDIETATHTNISWRDPFLSSGKTISGDFKPMPLFPKGTVQRMAQDINLNNNNPMYERALNEDIFDAKIKRMQQMIDEAERMRNIARSQKYPRLLKEANQLISNIDNYQRTLLTGDLEQVDEQQEEQLIAEYNKLQQEFTDASDITKQDLSKLIDLRTNYKEITNKWLKARREFKVELNQGQRNSELDVNIDPKFERFADQEREIQGIIDNVGDYLRTVVNPRSVDIATAKEISADLANVRKYIDKWIEDGKKLRQQNKQVTQRDFLRDIKGYTESEIDEIEAEEQDEDDGLADLYPQFDEEEDEEEDEKKYKLPQMQENSDDDEELGEGIKRRIKKRVLKKPIKKVIRKVIPKMKKVEKVEKNKNFHVIKF